MGLGDAARRAAGTDLALIIAGCSEHKLDPDHVASLRQTKWDVDEDLNRKTHKAAIEALNLAGIADIAAYLKQR